MKRLYLLRHGQTEFNVKKLVQGRCDSPLTDLGRKQAGMAAAWLKAHGVVPDKVVSSPLGRAMDTAQLVACELLGPDTAVEPCEGIIERSYGTFEEGPHDALPTDVWDPGELPTKLPNCAIMIFDFDEAEPQVEGEPMQCKFTLQQIVDPQQSH